MNKKKKDDMVGMVNAMYQKMGGHLPTEGAHEDEDDEEWNWFGNMIMDGKLIGLQWRRKKSEGRF